MHEPEPFKNIFQEQTCIIGEVENKSSANPLNLEQSNQILDNIINGLLNQEETKKQSQDYSGVIQKMYSNLPSDMEVNKDLEEIYDEKVKKRLELKDNLEKEF